MTTITTQQNAIGGANGNDITLDTVTSYTVPANTIGASSGDFLDYDAWITLTSNSDSKRVVIELGSAVLLDYTFPASVNTPAHIVGKVIANASAGIGTFEVRQAGQSLVLAKTSFAVNWAVAHAFNLLMQNKTNPVAIGWLEAGLLKSYAN